MAVNYYDLGLPDSVMEKVKYSPMEDVALTILRRAFPEVTFVSLIPDAQARTPAGGVADYFVLVRRAYQWGEWAGDPRGFIDAGGVEVHVYTKDPDGDLRGSVLSEAIRAVFEEASRDKWRVNDDITVHDIQMIIEPIRKADWATAQGPVQFADLPQGNWRYISTYQFKTRRQTRNP